MTIAKGGTITLGGKTYNISQINSVYTGVVNRNSGGSAFFLWLLGGFFGTMAIWGTLGKVAGGNLAGFIWIAATIAATIAALKWSSIKDYAVFFDMSSGKVSAFSDRDRERVEGIKNDIVRGLEEGYFPNYLQGGGNS